MSSTNKIVNAYAKSLFQKLKNAKFSSFEGKFIFCVFQQKIYS